MKKRIYKEPTRQIEISMIDDILMVLENYMAMLENEGLQTEVEEIEVLIFNLKVVRGYL